MKKCLALVLTLLFAAAAAAGTADWFEGSFAEAKDAAASQQKLLLIDFFSDG